MTSAQAYYKCEPNSITNEVLYYALIRQDGFSKFTIIEFGKTCKKGMPDTYYVVPLIPLKAKNYFLPDDGSIIIDGIYYAIKKNTNAPHIAKRHLPGSGMLLAEYTVPEDAIERIKNSKDTIKLLFNIEGKGEKILNFGLKTSDEIRFIVNRTFEDFFAVSKKQIVPTYTDKQ